MENSIIKDLFWGKIHPYEKEHEETLPAKNARERLIKMETLLLERLGSDDCRLLNDMIEAECESLDYYMEDAYCDGFRTGAKFILDIFGKADLLTSH